MKVQVEVKETSYGFVVCDVPDNASKEDIIEAARSETEYGNAVFGRSEVEADESSIITI